MSTRNKRNSLLRGSVTLFCLSLAAVAVAQAPTLSARRYRTITGHSEEARQIAFSPDSQLLATSSVDSTVKLWRVVDGRLVGTLRHPEGVTSIAFSPDGRALVSGSYDATVRVWDVRDGTLTRSLKGHTGTVWTVAFSPDGQRIGSGGEDKTIKIWRASDGSLLNTLRGHALNVWSVAFSPDGELVGSGSFDKTIKLWRTDTGALVRTLTGSGEAVVDIDFSPDGQLLASGGDDSMLRLWRISDGRPVRSFAGSDHIYGVAFSHDGKWIATGGRARGNLATLWQQVFGNWLLGGNGKTARLWRVSDGGLQQELSGHSDDVWSVALSPDGRWLATASEDKTVVVWALTQPRN
jgi:WD40 repeat protein